MAAAEIYRRDVDSVSGRGDETTAEAEASAFWGDGHQYRLGQSG
jgi:hypothetical protein